MANNITLKDIEKVVGEKIPRIAVYFGPAGEKKFHKVFSDYCRKLNLKMKL